MIYAFVVICLFGGALAQPPQRTCPEFSQMEDVNKTRFMGKWYVVESIKVQEDDCMSIKLFVVDGVNYGSYEYRQGGEPDSSVVKPDGYVQMTETLPYDFFEYITATDYTSYAIMYDCSYSNGPSALIMTRDPHPTKEVLARAHNILKKKNNGDVKLFGAYPLDCKPTKSSRN